MVGEMVGETALKEGWNLLAGHRVGDVSMSTSLYDSSLFLFCPAQS
jgi:hypothetical protein